MKKVTTKHVIASVAKQSLGIVMGLLMFLPIAALAQFQRRVTPFTGTSTASLPDAIRFGVNWFLSIVALIAAVFFVYGGVRYITSAGDEQQAESAKRTILYSLVGLIVIGLSYAIITFVIGAIA